MAWCLFLLWLAGASWGVAQELKPSEVSTSPFDFDNYRRTPLQARESSRSWASKDNTDLQRGLISGELGKKQDIVSRVDALFPDSPETVSRPEPEPLPTPNELTDEITASKYGETTKGQRDLLARSRVAQSLDLSSMSETDYELYVAQHRAEQEPASEAPSEDLLRPMPTLINSKTGGPPHAYAVSQAGVGARAEPRSGENPFADLIRALRLDRPVTKGTDPLPAPSVRLAAAPATPVPAANESTPTPAAESPQTPESNP